MEGRFGCGEGQDNIRARRQGFTFNHLGYVTLAYEDWFDHRRLSSSQSLPSHQSKERPTATVNRTQPSSWRQASQVPLTLSAYRKDVYLTIEDLETPLLTVDLDIVEANINRLQSYADRHGLRNRPHIKTHKLPLIAHMQIRAGAVGIACQKLSEAEIMGAAGIHDIQIVFPVIGPRKVRRAASLAGLVRLSIAADSFEVAKGLAQAADAHGTHIDFYVDCDTGWKRTGVQTPEDAIALAEAVDRLPALSFAGLLTYPTSSNVGPWFREVFRGLDRIGLEKGIACGGGTPGVLETHAVSEIDEIRAGTYAYGDRSTIDRDSSLLDSCALQLRTTVVSSPTDDRVIVDAGTKALTTEPPEGGSLDRFGHVLEYPEAVLFLLEEEHGHIDVSRCASTPLLGETITVIPNNANAVVNMFNTVVLHRSRLIQTVLPIAARGALE